ncbi:hypothetical protein [Thiomonas sp.]|jgi:hypothetical protein|uniref:hypothetical protein n=1 Tax=Thiomonas sp. TaxID=2047785 RepID=UPI002589B37F|nr:hypothetical protein [Thiomonas sp.]
MKLKISVSHWLGMTAGLGLVAVSTYACIVGGTVGLLTLPIGVFGALGAWVVWLDILMSQRPPTKRQAELMASWKRQRRNDEFAYNWDGTPMVGGSDIYGRAWGDMSVRSIDDE